jgi:hypothetical protein
MFFGPWGTSVTKEFNSSQKTAKIFLAESQRKAAIYSELIPTLKDFDLTLRP